MQEETLSVVSEEKVGKKYHRSKNNRGGAIEGLADLPIYNDEMMKNILDGIAKNIYTEMEKKHFTLRELNEISGVSYSHLSRIFNFENNMSLSVFIKLAYALRVRPGDLFPYDVNKRKTYGERFDEMTKEMDLATLNFLLGYCADFTREYYRIRGMEKL